MDKEVLIYMVVIAVIFLIIGILSGRYLLMKIFSKKENELKEKAKQIIKEAQLKSEITKKDILTSAREETNKMKNECEIEITRRKQIAQQNENKLKQRDQILNQKMNELKRKEDEIQLLREKLNANFEQLDKKKEELEKIKSAQVLSLEKIANLSAEQATVQIMESLKDEAKTRAAGFIRSIVEESKLTANKEAKKIVVQSIQRLAAEFTPENSVSVFHLESEEIKGRIIGREGRNIRALEAATGVEIIVDDTPDAIVLSCFDSVRREIARLALHKLVTDGRIHPARIEEVVEKIKKNIDDEIIHSGERTVIDLGIHGLHPELVKLLGRMRYRSSYGQNLLHHSREVANLCSIMASELGVNSKLAKRAGLLHDIGKVYFEDPETPHALLGKTLAEKYNENSAICNAIGSHHDEIEMTHIISPIVQACDAISGARPGARREVIDSYTQRIKDLENLALSYNGVSKCYAIQAGRELRVMVEADKINDEQSNKLSFEIAQKIQNDMQYPGQIKITVIRETRAVAVAK